MPTAWRRAGGFGIMGKGTGGRGSVATWPRCSTLRKIHQKVLDTRSKRAQDRTRSEEIDRRIRRIQKMITLAMYDDNGMLFDVRSYRTIGVAWANFLGVGKMACVRAPHSLTWSARFDPRASSMTFSSFKSAARAHKTAAVEAHFAPGGPHSRGECGPCCTAFDY